MNIQNMLKSKEPFIFEFNVNLIKKYSTKNERQLTKIYLNEL